MEKSVNALECIKSKPVDDVTFQKAKITLQNNFGVVYEMEKWNTLVFYIKEDGWSYERFERTFSWFLKHKKFPAWTIADWFDYEIKVYNHQWYKWQQHSSGNYTNVIKQMDVYRLPTGQVVYKWADGEDLPFERINFRETPYWSEKSQNYVSEKVYFFERNNPDERKDVYDKISKESQELWKSIYEKYKN